MSEITRLVSEALQARMLQTLETRLLNDFLAKPDAGGFAKARERYASEYMLWVVWDEDGALLRIADDTSARASTLWRYSWSDLAHDYKDVAALLFEKVIREWDAAAVAADLKTVLRHKGDENAKEDN